MAHCDFCGYDFDPGCVVQSCQGCPLVKSCGKTVCPRCGYEVLPEAWLVTRVRALIKLGKEKRGASMEVHPK